MREVGVMAYLKAYHTAKGTKYLILEQGKTIANLGYCSRKEADKILRQLSQEIARQKLSRKFHLRDDRLLFSSYLDEYIDTYLVRKAKNTINSELQAIAELKAFLGNIPLTLLSKRDIEDYINHRLNTGRKRDGKPLSPESINLELRYLRGILNKAVEDGYIDGSPFKGVKFLRTNKPVPEYLSPEEFQRFLDKCPVHLRAIVFIDVLTGLRKGELLNLKFQDIDFDRGYIKVTNTKGKRDRIVELNDEALEELRFLRENYPHPRLNRYLPREPHQREYVFCNPEGKPYQDIRASFNTALKQAGLPRITLHTLRKTYLSWLARAGVHPKIAQMLAGHSDIGITMDIYTGVGRQEIREAVNNLPRIASGRRGNLRVIK